MTTILDSAPPARFGGAWSPRCLHSRCQVADDRTCMALDDLVGRVLTVDFACCATAAGGSR